MKYPSMFTRIGKIKKNEHWSGCEITKPLYIIGGSVKWWNHFGK